MTKDNQSNKKTPGIINRKPQSGLDGQTTWRKLDEQKPKPELQAAFEQAFVASADDREKQILDDKKAAKIVALIEQKERISNLKEKRMMLMAQAQGKDIEQIPDLINRTQRPKSELEVELETVITDGLIEGFPPPYDNQPPVIELGSFETWDCNKVSFTKRDPVIPEHGDQVIDNPYFGLLSNGEKCWHPSNSNGFCTTCGGDVMVSVGDPPTKADVIVKQVQDRIKANNGYGQEKYQHQINVKLTDEDMKRANAIKADIFSDDVSGSQLMRILIRQGMKKYEGNQ